MLKRVFVAIAMSIGIAATAVAPSQAMSISSAARSISATMPVRNVEFSERTKLSYQLFCLQYGNECRTSSRNVVAYTSKLRTVLASVNRTVNRVMPDIRARREFLSLNPLPGAGDDHAMMKRSHLIRAGLPAGAMRVASVTTPEGRRHSVLVITTSTGELVLDHRQASVMKRRDTGYSFAALSTVRFFD
ncbi:transglutaminase-like cysteine peptidase [Pararhizobium sp. BT-229]|uniref:transglutaminase-like cysteine peptidase n=1 Tax=Pararhizobium sp. BT-229 TaxID=2986923 RepID=UPI0021F6D4B5|nr:transglutaminase-like cysteine peptidase [Pararhizobium sp. BT-229]MCV9962654.1 transglutaminase-like cysteine peptidase [Pararhizobium sp. BT-229]